MNSGRKTSTIGRLTRRGRPRPRRVTCERALWASLLQHGGVALVHVLEHPVQGGVEQPR